jgi:hypothetical protein
MPAPAATPKPVTRGTPGFGLLRRGAAELNFGGDIRVEQGSAAVQSGTNLQGRDPRSTAQSRSREVRAGLAKLDSQPHFILFCARALLFPRLRDLSLTRVQQV